MIGIGIAGFGYWGPNLLRAFTSTPVTCVRAICDLRPELLQAARHRNPVLPLTASYNDLLRASDIDAIVIATPVSTHFEMALAAIRAGKHVFVEKPMSGSSSHAAQLVEEASRRRLTLMVDYPYIYSSAIRKIRDLIASREIGKLYYYDSVRINLGRFRPDVDVIWDLAAHDLAILDYLTGKEPVRVSATGARHFPGERHNMAYVTLFYDDGLLGHIHVNWLAPLKVRRTMIGGSRKMIVYDDLEPSEKVRIYDRGITWNGEEGRPHQLRVGYRAGDLSAPWLEISDSLDNAALHFAGCVSSGSRPLTDGEAGLRVLRQLEAATASLEVNGNPSEFSASVA